jgi:hypothetical protein
VTRWQRAEHSLVVGLCVYEVAAIFSRGHLPTLTAFNRRWPVVGDSLVAALAWHFRAAART